MGGGGVGSGAGRAKSATAGRRSIASVPDSITGGVVSFVALDSPLLRLWERLGQAAARQDLDAAVGIGDELVALCRSRKVAS